MDHRALNSRALGQQLAHGAPVALCGELGWQSGELPEWVHLLPLGPDVIGADGRAWKLLDPAALVAASPTEKMVLDYEHATDVKAPNGDEAPAAAWIRELEVVTEASAGRIPGIWGRADWTDRGAASVRSQEYRFLSPVFVFEKDTGAIVRLERAGLTNRPNLELKALNREEPGEGVGMKPELLKALCAMLALPEGSNEDAVMTAVNSRKASSIEMVPRADLETALNRAKAAESRLAERDKADHERDVELALNQAVEAGKVSPASREHYRAICATAEGLKTFRALCETLPALCGNDQTTKKATEEARAQASADGLTEEERARCTELGLNPETYAKVKRESRATEGG